MGHTIMGLGIFLWLTPCWYPLLRYVLFKRGIGSKRRGKPRRMNLIDWLSATGSGTFAGAIAFVIGQLVAGYH